MTCGSCSWRETVSKRLFYFLLGLIDGICTVLQVLAVLLGNLPAVAGLWLAEAGIVFILYKLVEE